LKYTIENKKWCETYDVHCRSPDSFLCCYYLIKWCHVFLLNGAYLKYHYLEIDPTSANNRKEFQTGQSGSRSDSSLFSKLVSFRGVRVSVPWGFRSLRVTFLKNGTHFTIHFCAFLNPLKCLDIFFLSFWDKLLWTPSRAPNWMGQSYPVPTHPTWRISFFRYPMGWDGMGHVSLSHAIFCFIFWKKVVHSHWNIDSK
jgi:hypothetical protein